MRFSIIIPTYNSAATLQLLLDSLKAQSISDFETIVVDDASLDNTADLVARYPVRYERLAQNRGPAAARNHAAGLAKGEWLVFADADTIFAPDTLERIRNALSGTDAAALIGTYAGKPANDGFLPRFKALWEWYSHITRYAIEERELFSVTVWVPRPGVIRRSVFEELGGFDVRFSAADLEDVELGYRMVDKGYPIYFASSVRIAHNYPDRWTEAVRCFSRRCALWMRMFLKRWKFDCAGDGSPKMALGHFVGFCAFCLACGSLYWGPLAVAAAAAFGTYALIHRRFISLAWRDGGPGFMVLSLATALTFTVLLGFAAGYGFLTALVGKR